MKKWWKRNSIQKSRNVDNAIVLLVGRSIAHPLGKVLASYFFFLFNPQLLYSMGPVCRGAFLWVRAICLLDAFRYRRITSRCDRII